MNIRAFDGPFGPVLYLDGDIKDDEFQEELLDKLNEYETTRLFNVLRKLVEHGYTNLHVSCDFDRCKKYVSITNNDIPEPDPWDSFVSFDCRQLGGYYLSGGPHKIN